MVSQIETSQKVRRRPRRRISFCGPLATDVFGVPVYSRETVKALSKYADVYIITTDKFHSELNHYAAGHETDLSKFCPEEYDGSFFVFGNNPHHLESTLVALRSAKGIGIYHDAQQLDFFNYALGRQEVEALARIKLNRSVSAREIESWFKSRDKLPYPFLEPTATLKSHRAVVHSPLQREIHSKYYEQSTYYIPVAIQHTFEEQHMLHEALMRAKIRCCIHEREIHVGTFGYVEEHKLNDLIISALRHLHDWGWAVHLWIVGVVTDEIKASLSATSRILEVENFLHFSGCVTESEYLDFLLAIDLAIQLRRPMFGQLSGGLLDCVSAGLNTVSNESLASAIEAPSYVHRVKDGFSSIDVAERIAAVLDNTDLTDRSHSERREYIHKHSFDQYAKNLLELC